LKAARVTVITITHRPLLLAAMDKVILLRDGVIEKAGNLADIVPPVRAVSSDPGSIPVTTAVKG